MPRLPARGGRDSGAWHGWSRPACPMTCMSGRFNGALPFADQRAAIRPESAGRKLVARHVHRRDLADHRGRAHRGRWRQGAGGARFDPARGMSRLVTEDVSRAEAEQRRGRAGRTAPGTCYRLWTRGQDGARPGLRTGRDRGRGPRGPSAGTGAMGGAEGLRFLTPPPEKALAEARALLTALGAVDDEGPDHEAWARPRAAAASTRGWAIWSGGAVRARHGSPRLSPSATPCAGRVWASTSCQGCARSISAIQGPMPA